jgi:hypothetical protein
MKTVITVKCPGCAGQLEIDVAREKVISHKRKVDLEKPDKNADDIFGDAVARARRSESEAERAFEKAREEQKRSADKLDALFGDMKEKLKEQKEKGIEPSDDEVDPRLFWD